jgi:sugar phosphate isomerase/epimerase
MNRMTRREWMGAAALGIAFAGSARAELQKLRFDRLNYRLSIAAYSLRQYLPQNGRPGRMTMEELFERAAAWGFDAVEPTSYYFTSEEPAYVNGLKAKAHRLGLQISGTAIRNNYCHPDAASRRGEIAHVKKWIDIAARLGAPVIRVFAGNQHAGQSDDAARALVVEGLKETCDYAGEAGVFLGIENHGYLTENADELIHFIESVNHPWLGINLDSGNFKSDPYGNMTKAAPYAVNVQLKTDLVSAGGAGREPGDFQRIFQILYDAEYKGCVALEYEAAKDPLEGGVLEFLKAVRAGHESASTTRPRKLNIRDSNV